MIKITRFVKEIGTVNRYSLLGRLRSDCEYFLGYGTVLKNIFGPEMYRIIYGA